MTATSSTDHLTNQKIPVYSDFNDYLDFQNHQKLNKKEMFESQFLDFMKWFKDDIHKRYSRKDFQRMELNLVIRLFIGYSILFGLYLYLHTHFPQHALLWGVPMFIAAMAIVQKSEVMHSRAHSPNSLTGVDWVDEGIDKLGLPLTGVSSGLFKRRHCAAHYNDIGNLTRIFSEVWITFDKVPVNFHFRPHLPLKFLLDKDFCKQEMLNRKKLVYEVIGFYVYMALLIGELFNGSYFLLAFHLIPAYILVGSQVLSAIIVHSGVDHRNSFESNGIFDYTTYKGLFKVPMMFYCWIGNGGVINHGIHHAYPQVPLSIINKEYKRINQHILENYSGVRYNNVLAMRVQKNLLDRLPEPNAFDYVVTFGISVVALLASMLAVAGLPIPPNAFELMLVDYRIFFYSTKAERNLNKIAFLDSLHLEERYLKAENPNTYFKWTYRYYNWMKKSLEKDAAAIAS